MNSFVQVISWKNKPIFTEIILLFIRQNKNPYGQSIIGAFGHMEFSLIINLKMGDRVFIKRWLEAKMIALNHFLAASKIILGISMYVLQVLQIDHLRLRSGPSQKLLLKALKIDLDFGIVF